MTDNSLTACKMEGARLAFVNTALSISDAQQFINSNCRLPDDSVLA